MEKYSLPGLGYEYDELEPYLSEEQLRIHHEKHHAGYVKNANKAIERLDHARETGEVLDMKSELKNLSFHVGGHILHSLMWKNLSPNGGGKPKGNLAEEIDKNFGSFEQFKKEFEGACNIEGSGWAALAYCNKSDRLMLVQIEKHNVNVVPGFSVLMVLDMWEHAFYIDYWNEKQKFIDAFWNIVNWEEVNKRLEEAMS